MTAQHSLLAWSEPSATTAVPSPPHPIWDTALNGDPTAQGFIDGTDLRLAVTDDPPSDGVNIYDPSSGSLITSTTWSGVNNLYAVVPLNGYFYALDFDSASIVELDSSYNPTGVSYTLPSSLNPDPSTYTAYGQSLFTAANGDLYGLFIFYNPATYPPPFASTSLLVKFTVTAGSPNSITVGTNDYNSDLAANTLAAAFDGSQYLYTAATGGSQTSSYNSGSAIQKIDLTTANLSTAPVTTLLSGSSSHTDYLDISTDGAGTFYILSGLYSGTSSSFNGLLQSTPDFSTFTTIDTISSALGYCWAAQYTPENQRIWEGRGNQIVIYDASASPVSTAATLAVNSPTSGWNLISGDEAYDTLNNFSYVGASGFFAVRGATSPIQASNQPWARKARAITKGRPFLTKDEFDRLQRELGEK